PADPLRNLAGVWLPYRAKGTSTVASANPSIVVERSVYMASDILAGKIASTSSATSSEVIYNHEKRSDAKIRPWLQSFDLGVDTSRGIYYGVGAVRAQIDAAETAGASGWLLWDPENTYDEAALKKE
ncbi:MAG: hypothetical protein HYT40_01350, partial [Candidatus Sungbacteria bacterium]|nr:hypothetical protein [Candidatus Sungbacteria bacterium]